MKQKGSKKLIIAGGLSLLIIIAVVITIINLPSLMKKDETPIEEMTPKQVAKLTVQERADLNEWDLNIVPEITEDNIPIPEGFSYVQGDKSTGLIVKDEDGVQYLFIPYDKDAKVDVSEYYKKINNCYQMETTMMESIEKYKGFYVTLNSNAKLDNLKTIDKKNYEFNAEQMYLLSDASRSINQHLLYKEEIAQINNYIKKNNINLGENTIGIKALVVEIYSSLDTAKTNSTNNSLTSRSTNNRDENDIMAEWIETTSKLYGGTKSKPVSVPIPRGFDYCKHEDGYISIRPKEFNEYDEAPEEYYIQPSDKMTFIWVP